MTPQEAILKEFAEAKQEITQSLINRIWRNNSTLIYSGSTEARIILDALEKQIPRADAEELDCENCIWNNYPVYFKKKCVPCELLKCDCFSKVMYEDWSDTDD